MSCGEDNVCSNVYVRCFCYSHKQVHTCQISFFLFFFLTPHIVLVLIKYVNDVLIAAQFDTECAAVHRKKKIKSPSWFIVADLEPCSKFQNQSLNLFKKIVDVDFLFFHHQGSKFPHLRFGSEAADYMNAAHWIFRAGPGGMSPLLCLNKAEIRFKENP